MALPPYNIAAWLERLIGPVDGRSRSVAGIRNNTAIQAVNAAGSANIDILKLNASDIVQIPAANGVAIDGQATVTGAATLSSTVGVTGAVTLSSTLGVTGATTLTGGLVSTGRFRYSTIPIGGVAYASLGTSTTPTAGTIYFADIFIPRNMTLTGIGVLNAGTVGTNKWVVGLYNSAGTLVKNSALAGATTSGANAFQEVPFTATYAAVGPARYWIGVQLDGNTDRFRTVAASTYIDVLTTSAAGAFGTLTALTPPTTFTADVGPIAYVY